MYLYNHIYQCLYSFIKKFLPCVSKIYICLYIYMYMYTLYKLILFDDKILKKGSCTCTLYLVVSVLTHPTCLVHVHVTFYYYDALKLYLLHCCKVQGYANHCVCVCVCVCVCISTFHRIWNCRSYCKTSNYTRNDRLSLRLRDTNYE